MIAKLKFWGMTVGTTVLIWYAADQSVTTAVDVIMPFKIRPAVQGSMVIALPEEDELRNVRLELKGPNRAVSDLRAQNESLDIPLEIDERDSGVYTLDLLEAYRRQMDRFPEGLAIVSVEPRTVTIEVDRYVKREARLKIGQGDELLAQWQLDRVSVTAMVPETQFEALPADQRVIVLDVTQWVAKAKPGELHRDPIAVPRNLAGVSVLSVEPQQVMLSGTVLQRIEKLHVKTIPIGVKFSSNELTDYRVKFSDGDDKVVTVELWIRGPVEQILKIKAEPTRHIEGFIKITHQDVNHSLKPGETIPKVPHFLLPQGLVVEARAPEELHIQLIPRE